MSKKQRKVYDQQFELEFANFIIPFFEAKFNIIFNSVQELVKYYNQQRNNNPNFIGLNWAEIDNIAKIKNIFPMQREHFCFKFFHDNLLVHNLQSWPQTIIRSVDREIDKQLSTDILLNLDQTEFISRRRKIINEITQKLNLKDDIHPYQSIENHIRLKINKIVKECNDNGLQYKKSEECSSNLGKQFIANSQIEQLDQLETQMYKKVIKTPQNSVENVFVMQNTLFVEDNKRNQFTKVKQGIQIQNYVAKKSISERGKKTTKTLVRESEISEDHSYNRQENYSPTGFDICNALNLSQSSELSQFRNKDAETETGLEKGGVLEDEVEFDVYCATDRSMSTDKSTDKSSQY